MKYPTFSKPVRTSTPLVIRPRTEPRRPDVINLIMRINGCTFAEAVERLATLAGLTERQP